MWKTFITCDKIRKNKKGEVMTDQEQRFWNRVLELSWERVKELVTTTSNQQTVYDFFVMAATLISVSNNTATVLIEENRDSYWKTNLEDIILVAGIEVFNQQLQAKYIHNFDNSEKYEEEFHTPVPQLIQTPSKTNHIKDSNLNPKYRFENFIQGEGNRFAAAAAISVASDPFEHIYNPFFIWGGPGLGKTHLLNAIGNRVLEENPNIKVKYITAENFINEFIDSLKNQNTMELKEKFRNLDVLLIDDIQLLANKVGTQEEFFNTFNALKDNGKQIVLTSDRAPEQLNGLEQRLVTRFVQGMKVDITPPDIETRIAILRDKIQDYPYIVLQETIEYLAGQFNSNVRELEGALKNIYLVSSVKQVNTITIDIAAEAIRSKKQTDKSVISIDDIQNKVGNFFGVSVKDIKSTKRNQDIVLARQVAIFLTRELTEISLPKIGKEFGGRDHSTILHAYNKIKNMIESNDSLRMEIEDIRNKL